MARKKPQTTADILNREQANEALAEIAELERQAQAIDATLNERVDAVKAEADRQAAPVKERIKQLGAGLEIFAKTHREQFKDRRSLNLVHGALGFRRSSEVKPLPRLTLGAVLEKLKALGMREAIRTREEVDKEVLREWPEERLEMVGARRVEKDTFWYETAKEEVAGDIV